LQVIQFAREVTGREILIGIRDRRVGDPARLVADPARAKDVLGWEPQTSDIRIILQSAWTWHLRNPEGYSLR
jgi:UDP-glucose 4-epimerase